MTYATLQDLIDRFGEEDILDLADRDADGVADQAVVDQALGDAGDLIDSYLARRYELPLAAVPAVLTGMCANIARFKLHRHAPPEAVRKAYEDALKWLRDVSEGRAALDAAGSEPAPATATIQVESSTKRLGREKLEGF